MDAAVFGMCGLRGGLIVLIYATEKRRRPLEWGIV